MLGLDPRIAELGSADALVVALAVALLLGLRHATDPDHLTAVSTLIASDHGGGSRRAGVLGLAWGAGHASTLLVLGLPVVLFDSVIPEVVQRSAEVAIGVVIMALAIRLLLRWRAGRFHAHVHRHGNTEHRHLHPHAAEAGHGHGHEAESRLGRSPLQAYGIGLVHGVGGSAGVGVLLLASIPDQTAAMAALVVFAAGTAISMALASSAFGFALTRGPVLRRLTVVAPALGVVSLAFGAWYALGGLQAVPYPF